MPVRRWRQYRAMSRDERRLFWYALFHLARLRWRLARLSLADVLAAEYLVPVPEPPPALPTAAPETLRRARTAVTRAARALPFRTSCLVRALAEMRVLAREKAPAELCIGFQRGPDRRVAGHAWVVQGGRPKLVQSAYGVAARYRARGFLL
jgi:hypothetical protein